MNLTGDVVEHVDRDEPVLQSRPRQLDEPALEVLARDQQKVGKEHHNRHLASGGGQPLCPLLEHFWRADSALSLTSDRAGTQPFPEPTRPARERGRSFGDVGADAVEQGTAADDEPREEQPCT